MKKIFTSLCATLLICFTLSTPLGKISSIPSLTGDLGISTYGFYLAIEGQ